MKDKYFPSVLSRDIWEGVLYLEHSYSDKDQIPYTSYYVICVNLNQN